MVERLQGMQKKGLLIIDVQNDFCPGYDCRHLSSIQETSPLSLPKCRQGNRDKEQERKRDNGPAEKVYPFLQSPKIVIPVGFHYEASEPPHKSCRR